MESTAAERTSVARELFTVSKSKQAGCVISVARIERNLRKGNYENVENDTELSALLKGVHISAAGVVPFIHEALLKPKTKDDSEDPKGLYKSRYDPNGLWKTIAF